MGEQSNSDEVELGYVSGLFGVRGELRLFLHNRATAALDAPRPVTLVTPEGERRSVRLSARSGAGKRVIGRIDGVVDRDAATAIQGSKIFVDLATLPPLEDGEFWIRDVIDKPVLLGKREVGTVIAVHQTGPVDIFEIEVDGETHWVPALHEVVLSLDGKLELAEDALD